MEKPERPDDLLLENQLCFHLYAASRRIIQLYIPFLQPLGLTYTQYITLLALWEQPVLSVKALGERLMLDTGTLTPLLKKMEQHGLVSRRRSTQDERCVLISLTPQGEALEARVREFLPQLMADSGISLSEAHELRRALRHLLQALSPSDYNDVLPRRGK